MTYQTKFLKISTGILIRHMIIGIIFMLFSSVQSRADAYPLAKLSDAIVAFVCYQQHWNPEYPVRSKTPRLTAKIRAVDKFFDVQIPRDIISDTTLAGYAYIEITSTFDDKMAVFTNEFLTTINTSTYAKDKASTFIGRDVKTIEIRPTPCTAEQPITSELKTRIATVERHSVEQFLGQMMGYKYENVHVAQFNVTDPDLFAVAFGRGKQPTTFFRTNLRNELDPAGAWLYSGSLLTAPTTNYALYPMILKRLVKQQHFP